jgi:hypothetical protein
MSVSPSRRSVEVVVGTGINAEELAQLVARVGGLVGCRTCGLGGIDLRLVGSDPAALKQEGLEGITNVHSVVISEL